MEKILRIVSIEEAEDADLEYFKTLTNEERISLAFKLMEPVYATYPRLERIYRIVDFKAGPISDGWRMGG